MSSFATFMGSLNGFDLYKLGEKYLVRCPEEWFPYFGRILKGLLSPSYQYKDTFTFEEPDYEVISKVITECCQNLPNPNFTNRVPIDGLENKASLHVLDKTDTDLLLVVKLDVEGGTTITNFMKKIGASPQNFDTSFASDYAKDKFKPKIGDMLTFTDHTFDLFAIYDGQNFINLDYSVMNLGSIPRSLKVIEELPLTYWSLVYRQASVFLNPNSFELTNVTLNQIPNDVNINRRNIQDNKIGFFELNYEEKIYYVVVYTRNYDLDLSDLNLKILVDNPVIVLNYRTMAINLDVYKFQLEYANSYLND